MQNHVKRKHQSEVKAVFKNGDVNHVTRAADELFSCLCGSRRFLNPHSLQRHAKKCERQTAVAERTIKDGTTELDSEAEVTIESMSTEAEGDAQVRHKNDIRGCDPTGSGAE